MIVVSDTSAISALFRTGHLDLLQKLFKEIIISETVKQELLVLKRWGYETQILDEATWIRVERVQNVVLFEILLESLDAGEAEAIALAKELNADVLLIDEAKGRKVAQETGIPILGLLGMLVQAKREAFIPNVRPVLEKIVTETKFRISPSLAEHVLQQIGE